jgi:hypothetical protein
MARTQAQSDIRYAAMRHVRSQSAACIDSEIGRAHRTEAGN